MEEVEEDWGGDGRQEVIRGVGGGGEELVKRI